MIHVMSIQSQFASEYRIMFLILKSYIAHLRIVELRLLLYYWSTCLFLDQDVNEDEWYVKLSYGPRWITYFVGSGNVLNFTSVHLTLSVAYSFSYYHLNAGVLTIVILLVFKIFAYLLVNGHSQQNVDITTGRSPLLPNKDDDTASLGSSYDSVSHDEEDIEGKLDVSSKLLNEGEADTLRRLCAVCCDAQRDSFFLPCGHCATCFTCGTRCMIHELGILFLAAYFDATL